MAERRMFAKTIVLSDAFLDMPMSARCLYFTLGMLADDDGFINAPRSIMRQCGASDDDMKLLIAKKFVLVFESGVIVIKHWRINNYLRNDRYTETKYVDEKSRLTLDEKGIYHSAGIPPGIPSIGKDRLGKDRIGKVSIDNSISANAESVSGYSNDFELFWSEYPRKVGKKDAFKAFKKAQQPVQILISAVREQKQSEMWTKENGRFIPNPATWLNQGRWDDTLPKPKTGVKNGSGFYTLSNGMETSNPFLAMLDEEVNSDKERDDTSVVHIEGGVS